MIKYEINSPFPFPHPSPGEETTLSEITTSLFDVRCYLSNPTSEEINDWRKGSLRYAFFDMDSCPFFILCFDGWNLDCSINILKIRSDEEKDAWLNAEGNVINLFLIDAKTNVLKAMRMISIQKDASEKLKDVCEAQTERFENAMECDSKIFEIYMKVSIEQMLKLGKVYKLK